MERPPKLVNTELKNKIVKSIPSTRIETCEWAPFWNQVLRWILRFIKNNYVFIIVATIFIIYLCHRYKTNKQRKIIAAQFPKPPEPEMIDTKKYAEALAKIQELHQDRIAESEVSPR